MQLFYLTCYFLSSTKRGKPLKNERSQQLQAFRLTEAISEIGHNRPAAVTTAAATASMAGAMAALAASLAAAAASVQALFPQNFATMKNVCAEVCLNIGRMPNLGRNHRSDAVFVFKCWSG